MGLGGVYSPLVLSSLAKYENRMGMVHWRVTSYRGESNSVRSKDTLVLVQVCLRPAPASYVPDAYHSRNYRPLETSAAHPGLLSGCAH